MSDLKFLTPDKCQYCGRETVTGNCVDAPDCAHDTTTGLAPRLPAEPEGFAYFCWHRSIWGEHYPECGDSTCKEQWQDMQAEWNSTNA